MKFLWWRETKWAHTNHFCGSNLSSKRAPCFGKWFPSILNSAQSSLTWNSIYSEWLLTKIVNGERASYSAPKFARMQERTRSQMLEDIVANLANHAETGQIPKPYRRGSWRPIGHMRPSSPLLDSVRDQFEGNKNHFPTFYGIFISFLPTPAAHNRLRPAG